MFSVKDANHFFLFDEQNSARRNRSRRPDADGLAGQASFAKKIARSQDRHDRLFAAFIDNRKPYPTLLNVENVLARVTLHEDFFFFCKLVNFSGYTCRVQKILRIERGLGISLQAT